jgi:hypothetical protein
MGYIETDDLFYIETQLEQANTYVDDDDDEVKKGELQIWSLQISKFPRKSSSLFQPPYFRLRK